MKKSIIAIIALLCSLASTARERVCFDSDWKFILGDSAQMASVEYNDAHWRTLNVPHDWAIEGDFYAGNPSGAGGGALPGQTPLLHLVNFMSQYFNRPPQTHRTKIINFSQ